MRKYKRLFESNDSEKYIYHATPESIAVKILESGILRKGGGTVDHGDYIWFYGSHSHHGDIQFMIKQSNLSDKELADLLYYNLYESGEDDVWAGIFDDYGFSDFIDQKDVYKASRKTLLGIINDGNLYELMYNRDIPLTRLDAISIGKDVSQEIRNEINAIIEAKYPKINVIFET